MDDRWVTFNVLAACATVIVVSFLAGKCELDQQAAHIKNGQCKIGTSSWVPCEVFRTHE